MTPLCWGLFIVAVLLFAPALCWACANVSGLGSEEERDETSP